jgi:hypothetical protein
MTSDSDGAWLDFWIVWLAVLLGGLLLGSLAYLL